MLIIDHLDFPAKKSRFDRICRELLLQGYEQGLTGIGTLQEKWLHAVIKRYLTENPIEQEVKIEGSRFVADVKSENEIFEVQTGSFAPMQKKIQYCLEHTDNKITVVHPIAVNRWVQRMNPETGELSQKRKSPKHGNPQDLLADLYPLRSLLPDDRLIFRILLMDVVDIRLPAAPHKRGERYQRIPLALKGDMSFGSPADYRSLLPDALSSPFTVGQFSALTKLKGLDAYSAVRVLTALGLADPCGKIGRAMAFELKNSEDSAR